MSLELIASDGAVFRFTNFELQVVLEIARKYGWHPEGTKLGADSDEGIKDWTGAYDTSDGQHVSETDAPSICWALTVALADNNILDRIRESTEELIGRIESILGADLPQDALVPLRGAEQMRTIIGDFAEFCGEGGFVIQ